MDLIFASTTERPSGSARTRNRPHVASWVGQITENPFARGISLTGVRVVNGEANRHAAYPRACGEDPPFVMATVATVEHDAPGLASGGIA